MITLRILQTVLVVAAGFGFLYALRRRDDIRITARVVTSYTASVLALLCTQILPIAWLVVAGTDGLAKVTGIDCEQGQKHHVRFEFQAGAKSVSGLASDAFGAKKCDLLRVGDQGAVVYISGTPQIHVWGSLRQQLEEYLAACVFAAIVVPVISYVSIRKRPQTET